MDGKNLLSLSFPDRQLDLNSIPLDLSHKRFFHKFLLLPRFLVSARKDALFIFSTNLSG